MEDSEEEDMYKGQRSKVLLELSDTFDDSELREIVKHIVEAHEALLELSDNFDNSELHEIVMFIVDAHNEPTPLSCSEIVDMINKGGIVE